MFYLFRREQALNDSMIINVPEAAEGKYCIRVSDEFYNTREFTVEGAVLRTGISIKIPHKRQSAVVEYIALQGMKCKRERRIAALRRKTAACRKKRKKK